MRSKEEYRSPAPFFAAAFALLAALAAGGCSGRGAPPNCLILMVDTLRPDHMGCYGYFRDTSPAMDRLAGEGALFENAFSTTSWTLPAHAALFTSLFDTVHSTILDGKPLNEKRLTLAEVLKGQGFRTAGFYTGPYLSYFFGLSQGFDTYENCASEKTDDWLSNGDGFLKAHRLSHKDITSPRLLDRALRWMEENRQQPFFLFLHFFDVHYDYIPPPPFDKKFDPHYKGKMDGKNYYFKKAIHKKMNPRDLDHIKALYDGEIAFVDLHIGRLLQKMEEWNILNRTLIVLLGDHGEEFFEHGGKGHRQSLYDEVIRIPLIFRLPSVLPQKTRVSSPVRIIDVMPTVLEILRAPLPDEAMGASLLNSMMEGTGPDLPIFAELHLWNTRLYTFRTPKSKVILDWDRDRCVIFDLQRDPEEGHPASPFRSLQGQAMVENLYHWIRHTEDLSSRLPRSEEKEAILPESVKNQLKALGYISDEEERPAAGGEEPGEKRPPGRQEQ